MALAFTTGTINQPDAGSVGLAMVEKLRDDLVAHAAWELVEEFTAASGLGRWYVFKCLASISGLSADYFVIINRTLGSGELRVAICEGYNAGTHTASFYGLVTPTNVVTIDSLGRQSAATYVLGAPVLPTSGNSPYYQAWIPSGVSTKWWLIVADDGFTVAFSGASNGFFHIGAYTPLTVMPMLLPIGSFSHQSYGSLTRNPAAVGVAAPRGTCFQLLSFGTSIPSLGFVSTLVYNDKLQDNQRAVGELGILLYQDNLGDMEKYGYVVGKHKRVRLGGAIPVGVTFGDAYALQGRLWVPYNPASALMWDTGVAV